MGERVKIILLWFFGVMLLIAGFRALISISFLAGLIGILSGIALLPIFHKKIEKILNKNIQKRWFVIVALIFTTISGQMLRSAEEQALRDGTANQELKDREAMRIQRDQEAQKREAEKAKIEAQREAQRQERDRQISIEVDSEMALKRSMKDPKSVEIRNQNGVCGEVNSKNSFGGYTGFKRYVANNNIVVIEGENMKSSEFNEVWNKVCH